jgi:hypothetical protein
VTRCRKKHGTPIRDFIRACHNAKKCGKSCCEPDCSCDPGCGAEPACGAAPDCSASLRGKAITVASVK